MFTDPISDYLTRVRNAQMAGHKVVDIPASNMKKEITKRLPQPKIQQNRLRNQPKPIVNIRLG